MAVPDQANGEVVFKIVYAGTEGAGKTTSLAGVHRLLGAACEPAVGTETGSDRTIVFGFRPARPVIVRGLQARFQMITAPGPVRYAATWQLALRGADGIVFVADSQPDKMRDNADALKATFLAMQHNRSELADIPMVFQFNKRDLPGAVPVAEMDRVLNVLEPKGPVVESCAESGDGLLASLEALSKRIFEGYGGVKMAPRAPAGANPEAAPAPAGSPPLAAAS